MPTENPTESKNSPEDDESSNVDKPSQPVKLTDDALARFFDILPFVRINPQGIEPPK